MLSIFCILNKQVIDVLFMPQNVSAFFVLLWARIVINWVQQSLTLIQKGREVLKIARKDFKTIMANYR